MRGRACSLGTGRGTSTSRRIELTPWQQAIVDREPEQFVRGLLHSDGCRVMNRVVVDGKDRSLDRLGIHYTFSRRGLDVSIARRESVARLDSFVGKKS